MSLTAIAPFTRSAPGLVVVVSSEGADTVVAVRGELDSAVVPVVLDVLVGVSADHDGDVVVDLSQTDFIDSASVRALSRAGQFLTERGRRLTVRSPSRLAARVLRIHDLFDLVAPAEPIGC